MSRLGKKPTMIPEKTTVTVAGSTVTVKGPQGELSRTFPDLIAITINGAELTSVPKNDSREAKAMWGTIISHIRNMIAGVNTPYEKKLIVEGVGFKVDAKGTDLHLALGFSHPVIVPIPSNLAVKTEKGTVTIAGIDKEAVGAFAAKVRAYKVPEPYKGKGIRYSDEIIRRKQGKKSA
ncbi:MAG TPA: 50S ribosomal protein L6 [Candidatus Paceibacterota bacterium]|nr:50S ribosomal protein L6 [Candidatus Paceibacterota bacterium]